MPTLTITKDMQQLIDMQLFAYRMLKDDLQQLNRESKIVYKDAGRYKTTCTERKRFQHAYHYTHISDIHTAFRDRVEHIWSIKPGDHIEVIYRLDRETVHKFRCVYDGWEFPRGWGFTGDDAAGPYLKYHLASNPGIGQQFTPRACQIIQITNRNKHLQQQQQQQQQHDQC